VARVDPAASAANILGLFKRAGSRGRFDLDEDQRKRLAVREDLKD
jgi:hypothetical protein